ncbi:MAG TPA: gamma-glutamyltransferase, partial [Nitratifractor sp.]|nr:gamma-glutamyltransferase [Nitratifractor sp.]
MSKLGVISSGDERTSQAGAQMLKAGGNAFDAICAAMLTAPLCEPMLTSLGGGGFMLAKSLGNAPTLYDFFVDVPPSRSKKKDFYPIDVDFGTTTQTFHIGRASIAIPGVLKGIYEIHKERGSLPLSQIVQPAIDLAREGLYLSKMQAHFVTLLEPILRSTKESEALFTDSSGKLIDHTHLFVNKEYAEFLENFAKEGDAFFYSGEVAKSIENLCKDRGGDLRAVDLESYKVIKRKPISFNFLDSTII